MFTRSLISDYQSRFVRQLSHSRATPPRIRKTDGLTRPWSRRWRRWWHSSCSIRSAECGPRRARASRTWIGRGRGKRSSAALSRKCSKSVAQAVESGRLIRRRCPDLSPLTRVKLHNDCAIDDSTNNFSKWTCQLVASLRMRSAYAWATCTK